MHALLVGVSDYPTLPATIARTPGARNDVLLMREVLLQRGFSSARIRLLADGLADARPPTRANILQALDQIVDQLGQGDTLVVHLAGHGSQEPGDRPGESPSPIFLPADIGRWDGGVGSVKNAITRQDLRLRMDRSTGRGAFVWGVFDACHSAALVRGAQTPRFTDRFVSPGELGIPRDAIEHPAPMRGAAISSSVPVSGMFDQVTKSVRAGTAAYFYAAQPGESTVELPLPSGSEAPRHHGLFSFMVAQVLQLGRPLSYRQLGQAVQTAYAGIPEAYATPIFTGNALDRAVLGQDRLLVRQWPLRVDGELRLEAGALSGIATDTILAVLPGPTADDSEVQGYLRVTSVTPGRALVETVSFAGKPALSRSRLGSGKFVRIAVHAQQLRLRVAARAARCAGDCPLDQGLELLRVRGIQGVDIQWPAPSEVADVAIDVRGGFLEISPLPQVGTEAATFRRHCSLKVRVAKDPEESAGVMATALRTIARANSVLSLAQRTSAEFPNETLRAELRRVDVKAANEDIVAPNALAQVWPGNELVLYVTNLDQVPLDLTVLYMDANYGISPVFPGWHGESNRLMPGASLKVAGITITAPPTGIERLLVIGKRATSGVERTDFTFLAQPSVDKATANIVSDYLVVSAAAFADQRRRMHDLTNLKRDGVSIATYTLDVQPRDSTPRVRRGGSTHP